jgi:small subunit ribosomal protein S18
VPPRPSTGGRSGPGGKRGGKFGRNQRKPTTASKMRVPGHRKPSYLQEHRLDHVDYKDVKLLQKLMNPQGKILPRRLTRLTVTQQRELTKAVKRARFLAMLPYVMDSEAY